MIKRYKSIKKTQLFFIISYLSIFIFSLSLYTNNFHGLFNFVILLKSILTSIILWYILYLSSFNRVFYYIVVFLFSLLLTMKVYYSFIIGVHIEPSVFEGIFDTNIDEAKRLGSNKPILIYFSILALILIFVEFNWFKQFTLKKRILVHFGKSIVFGILLFIYGFYTKNLSLNKMGTLLKETFPISFINSFYTAAHARYKLYKMNTNKIDIVQKYHFKRKNDENVTVIFVRAESLRSRSFPITDKNLPLAYRIDDLNNTVIYKNVFSYANYTQAAVPWMLTRSVNDKLQNEKSLISVVRFIGFDSTWVGCDHSNLASFATPIVNYSLEANRSLFSGKLNEWLHQNISNKIIGANLYDGRQFWYILSHTKKSNQKNSFFWIEMNGSHVPWTSNVPKQFLLYKPYCDKPLDEVKECSVAEAQNAYKNTIVYTQYLLKKLISSLTNKNAIVFFASDHGESTGEKGNYGHGFMLSKDQRVIRDQRNPAFMVWMSDQFKNNHVRQFNALKNNSTKYMKHDIIFHSVLDILGIESEIINKKKSIFSFDFNNQDRQNNFQFKAKSIITEHDILSNKIVFYMKDSNPRPESKGILFLQFPQMYKEINFIIHDLYNNNWKHQIGYSIYYHNKKIYTADIGDKKFDKKHLVSIKFTGNDRNITIKIEPKPNISRTALWGNAAKIEIDFINRQK